MLVKLARIAAVRPRRELPTNKEFSRFSTVRFHLAFGNIAVRRYRVVGTKDVPFSPLIQGVVDRFRHGQQRLLPPQKLLPQLGKYRDGLRSAQGETLLFRKILGLSLHTRNRAPINFTASPAISGATLSASMIFL